MTMSEEDTFKKLRRTPIKQTAEAVLARHRGNPNGLPPEYDELEKLLRDHGWTPDEYVEAAKNTWTK